MAVEISVSMLSSTRSAVDVLTKTQALEPLVVRWLNAKFRLDRDKSDKSMKFGTQLVLIFSF